MTHATRSERREANVLGASMPLYRRARRAGATHDEVVSALREGTIFWRYELFRIAGVTHAQARALEAEGVDPIAFRDLRRIGIDDDEMLDARCRELPLDVYFSARKAGLDHDEAAALIEAGFQHAASTRAWKTAAKARKLLSNREQETRESLTLVVQRAPGFKGDAESLVKEIAAEAVNARERAA